MKVDLLLISFFFSKSNNFTFCKIYDEFSHSRFEIERIRISNSLLLPAISCSDFFLFPFKVEEKKKVCHNLRYTLYLSFKHAITVRRDLREIASTVSNCNCGGEINLTGNNSRNRIKYPLSLTQLRSCTQASDCPSTEKEARFEIKARWKGIENSFY